METKENKHPLDKDELRNCRLNLYLPFTQMPRGQRKNTIINSQVDTAQPELSYHTTANPGYCNTAEALENDHKTNFMKMIEALKVEMNNSLKEIQENINKQLGEMNKALNKS